MRAYILASQDRISFAEELLEGIKNVHIISRIFDGEDFAEININIKRKIKYADIILAIIDEKSINNILFNTELQIALMESKNNRNKILLPIVLGDAEIPTSLESMLYIKCNPESKEDLEKVRLKIINVMCRRMYIAKKKTLNESKSRTSHMIILTLAIEMFAILFVTMFYRESHFNTEYWNQENMLELSLGLITVMLAIGTLFTSYLSVMRRRWQEDDIEEIESYSRRLKQAIVPKEIKQTEKNGIKKEESKKEIDALGRMMINLEDIKEFYTWSQKQAKASFVLAVVMCGLGFGFILASVIVVFRFGFKMSIIPSIGGVVTEVVAGTALVVYKNSLRQLNHYHQSLHEDERFLSSVNLLGKFSTVEAQDEMLREIIRSEIQMNLSGIKDNEIINTNKSKN
ncbi:MAG: hypothetical protein E7262_00640 [Lachnospiraceae bacterium]|nr:hypothetical protein [Lachnospiraceae bacterium]